MFTENNKIPRPRKTEDQHLADIKYLLDDILDLKEKPDDPIRDAISYSGITSVIQLLSIDLSKYDDMSYHLKDDKGSVQITPLPDHSIGLLKSFKCYISHCISIGAPVQNQDWQSIDPGDFD